MTQPYHKYFDWAAGAPQDAAILSEAVQVSLECPANPSSIHKEGKIAREKIEQARSRCAAVLRIAPSCITFTSGGTEANQIALLSVLTKPAKGSILISSIEHPSVREQAYALKHTGWKIISVDCEKNGIMSTERILGKLQEDTALVCIMAVNNETGAVQPIYEIADGLQKLSQANKKKPKFHVDAVQAAGKIPFDFSKSGIDSAALSAHKIGGARGAGILYNAGMQDFFLRGGGQENGKRSGTENLLAIWSFMRALEKYAAAETVNEAMCKQHKITADFIDRLKTIDGCTLIPEERKSKNKNYSPWIVQARFKGIPGAVAVRALSEKGFCISTGSACSARKNERPVLQAMGITNEQAIEAVRFSFGHAVSDEDIDALVHALKDMSAAFSSHSFSNALFR